MILTLRNEIDITSKIYDGVKATIKVLTPVDVEDLFRDKNNAPKNSEIFEKYCIKVSGVSFNGKELTLPKEILAVGGSTKLVGEIATEILRYGVLGDEEKNA